MQKEKIIKWLALVGAVVQVISLLVTRQFLNAMYCWYTIQEGDGPTALFLTLGLWTFSPSAFALWCLILIHIALVLLMLIWAVMGFKRNTIRYSLYSLAVQLMLFNGLSQFFVMIALVLLALREKSPALPVSIDTPDNPDTPEKISK